MLFSIILGKLKTAISFLKNKKGARKKERSDEKREKYRELRTCEILLPQLQNRRTNISIFPIN